MRVPMDMRDTSRDEIVGSNAFSPLPWSCPKRWMKSSNMRIPLI